MHWPTQPITAAAWVRVDRPQRWGGIVGAVQDNGSYERGWLLGYNGSRFSFAVKAKQGADTLTYVTANDDSQLRSWHHVVGTYDGQHIRLYVDGKAVAESTAQSGDIDYPPDTFFEIGAYHDENEYYRLQGMLHETRVYRRALSAEEIQHQFDELAANFSALPVNDGEDVLPVGPWLQFNTLATATVQWESTTSIPSIVEVREENQWVRHVEARPKQHHTITLEDLKHQRSYEYRIATNAEATRWTKTFLCDTFFDYNARSVDTLPDPAFASLIKHVPSKGICLVIGMR